MTPRSESVIADLRADAARVDEWRDRADRLLAAEGAGHLVHDLPVRADGRTASPSSRPWRLDPIPFALDTLVFDWLRAAVTERMQALGAVLADLHGDRTLITGGTVPPEVLHASGRYRSDAVGSRPPRWLTTYAVDLVQTADGVWHVVQDLTDAPVGLGYALLDRAVMARVAPDVMALHGVAPLHGYAPALRRALASVSPVESPRTVVFSGGIDHPSYIEQSYLAVQLGVHLAEGADLVVRQRRLWLRTLDGLEPVDVLYRRLDDAAIDPLEADGHGAAGVPGLLLAVRSGGVGLANAHGSGVIEAPGLRPWLPAAIDAVAPLTAAIDMLPAGRRDFLTHPLATGEPAPVVLRMFAVDDGERVTVLPGGSGRVLAPADDPSEPTAGLAKDVWVLGDRAVPGRVWRLPQVDFARSVPTRVADSLYWMNRYAERAEAMTRLMRTIDSRFDQDPALLRVDDGRLAERAARVLHIIGGMMHEDGPPSGLDAALGSVNHALVRVTGSLLTEATQVRDHLSSTTGRVLEHLSRLRSAFDRHLADVDSLDAALADFAALAGLWNESTVRGPAWHIGDLGRRIERAAVMVDLVSSTVIDDPDPWTVEVALAAAESLVAYRRRYRSDVEAEAAGRLLVLDVDNPRSVAAALTTARAHTVALEWADGTLLVDEALDALRRPLDVALPLVGEVGERLGAALVRRWFSAPTEPVAMSGRMS
jgi:uncharacterized circularly permuted ATP-grasp superfamily protein/uncharacterized alpha-E superfamily protein